MEGNNPFKPWPGSRAFMILPVGVITGSQIAHLRAQTEFWGGKASQNNFQ